MDPAEREARTRVEAVYAAVDRLTPDDLARTPVPPRDHEERTLLIAELERTADRWGRGTLLDAARDALGQALATRAVSRFRAESGAVWVTTGGRTEDVAGLVLAIEDAVAVAATEDLLDPRDAAALADPGRRLLRLEPLPASATEPVPSASGWAPSPQDWAASDDGGPTAVDHEDPMVGNRRVQARSFGLIGAAGAMVTLGIGLAVDQPGLGVLGGLVIAGLAWAFARYRRPINRP